MMNNEHSYILITPARNEEIYIEKTIKSMVSQTVLPQKWVIVSDGSTDRTDEIVQRYTSKYNWIEFVRMPYHSDRQFAAKVHAFNAGYEKIKEMSYDIIGNLDGDITFEKDYFEFILSKFINNPSLGVAGTPFVEESFKGYDFRFTSVEHVSGACQLFRRECFEEIGGYIPVRGGGIDWIAVTTARMKGWHTRTFIEKTCFHHRKIGTGKNNGPMASLRLGEKDYYLGNHPLWEVCRSAYQMVTGRPLVLVGLFMLLGYILASARKSDRPISMELIDFCQAEQMTRLKKMAARIIKNKGLSG